MTPAIFGIVSASATCRSLLGTPPKMRFFAFGEADQVTPKVYPYAVWQLVTGTPANYLGQLPDNDDTRIQVDVYSNVQLTANVTAEAIRDAVEPYAYMVNFSERSRDATTRSYGYLMDFQFQTSR